MTVTLNLAPELVRRLEEIAAQHGKTLEAYLNEMATREADAKGTSLSIGTPAAKLTTEQWITEWREWAASRKPLNGILDDSRESIYAGRGE